MAENLKLFNEHSEYEGFIQTDDFTRPNVSYCIEEDEVHYNPIIPPDYSKEYLTFVAKADSTFSFGGTIEQNTLSYSLDNGSTWVALANNANTPTVSSGSKILWKGTCVPQETANSEGIGTFSSTAQFDVEGNAMSVLFGDDFKEQTSLEGKTNTFYNLFKWNRYVVSAKNLCLPATTLARNCYSNMFLDCTSLTIAPKLPATTLAQSCYGSMFQRCTSLTIAPELPATTLAENCYADMFTKCTGLIKTPELPATNLIWSCYNRMFNGCTSLTTAQQLPATTLASYCYSNMFYGCESLNYINAMFTSITSTTGTSNINSWVAGVSSTGIFVKNINATWTTTGDSGAPTGWTIIYFDPATEKYYLSDKTTECDDHGNVI